MNPEVVKKHFLEELSRINCPLKVSVEDHPIENSFEIVLPIEYSTSFIDDDLKLGRTFATYALNSFVDLACNGDVESEDSFLSKSENMMRFCYTSSLGIERDSVSFVRSPPLSTEPNTIAMSLKAKIGWVTE